MAFEDAGRLMIRGALASVFGYAALKHARSKKGTSSWLASVGYRDPDLSWAAMTASESAAALSMVLGAGTSLGASAVNGAMTSAVMTVHRQNGWPPGERRGRVARDPDGGRLGIGGPGARPVFAGSRPRAR